ncbi:MAG: response regulator [candidate division KSB1 bacterium]|nr:response regulator [candidate division KSB1 bacterium]MDZ7345500.1 response regulator [candidate division KSB1 bacterium]
MAEKTALVVDDSEINRNILSLYLELYGYKAVCEDDGLKGFETFKSIHPQLTFLDVVMPGISGIELLKKIKEYDPRAKVIMVTSHISQNTLKQIKDAQADWVLQKPFDEAKLEEIIQRIESA